MIQSDLCMIDGHVSPGDLIAGGRGLKLEQTLIFQVRLAVFDQRRVRLNHPPHTHSEISYLKACMM